MTEKLYSFDKSECENIEAGDCNSKNRRGDWSFQRLHQSF